MYLTSYGRPQWLTIIIACLAVAAIPVIINVNLWWASVIPVAVMFALLSFFRDPQRATPQQRNVMTSPADGKVSSVHEVELFEPFGEGAMCVRVFMSVLNVHVNRAPCYCKVGEKTHKPGNFISALRPESAEENESLMMILHHPTKGHPVAAVRQVAGRLARNIVNPTEAGTVLQRGERFGMIKFGSTAELYIPRSVSPRIAVGVGQTVLSGKTILAEISPPMEDLHERGNEVVAQVDEEEPVAT